MRFCRKQHPFYCGIDLHARTMYVCILSQDGEVMLHRNMPARPDALLKAIAPYRDGMVIAVECIFIVRRHHKEVTSRGSRACMLSRDRCYSTDTVVNVCMCAAPHPSLTLTGARLPGFPAFDEDGTRAPRGVEVAENSSRGFCTRHARGERTSRSVWCSHGGAPAWEIK